MNQGEEKMKKVKEKKLSCPCGKYQGEQYKDIICDRCGYEVTLRRNIGTAENPPLIFWLNGGDGVKIIRKWMMNGGDKARDIDYLLKFLMLHFGVGGEIEHSYKEIAEKFGISRQRVHQTLKAALKKVKIVQEEILKENSDV